MKLSHMLNNEKKCQEEIIFMTCIRNKFSNNKFVFLISLVFFLIGSKAIAQTNNYYQPPPIDTSADPSDSTKIKCGGDVDFFSTGVTNPNTGQLITPPTHYAYFAPATYAPSAIVNCGGGKIDLYFDDIQLHVGGGFDDPARGPIRVATFCKVISDIQNTFDFSHISPTGHLRVHVMQSLDNIAGGIHIHAACGDAWLARATPQYNIVPGLINGWFADYTISGVDPIPLPSPSYHAQMQVNFDQAITSTCYATPINWQDDYTSPINCTNDLYSALWHEMGHAMGFFSLVRAGAPTASVSDPTSVWGMTLPTYTTLTAIYPGTFTFLDASICGSATTSPGTIPLLTSSGGTYSVNPAAITLGANNNFWINNKPAPNNYPMFSGGFQAPGSFFAHVDDGLFSYSFRQRICPGNRQDAGMGPYGFDGIYHRQFCKEELQAFVNAMGYTLNPSYVTSHTGILSNHLPYSNKMGGMPIDKYSFPDFAESPTIIDYTMTNNIGAAPVDIDLTLAPFTSGDLVDGDLDPISIDLPSIVNIRGCGVGGNNHNGITVISPTHIQYTPRPNFYGTAQIGFNLTDGKEIGSYRVVTINVKMGNNVSPSLASGNYVCNGDFEEGSEQIRLGADETIPYGTNDARLNLEGKWMGVSYEDSHPFSFHINVGFIGQRKVSGCVVNNSCVYCAGTTLRSLYNTEYLNFPYSTGMGGVNDHPLPPSGGKRYEQFSPTVGSEAYYLLDTFMTQCNSYKIEFDLYNPHELLACAGSCTADLTLSFADHIGAFNFTAPAHSFPMTTSVWQHVSYTFYYCGTLPSNILYIGNALHQDFLIDNLSITWVPSPVMSVSVVSLVGTCTTHLTSTVTNPGCTPSIYSWTPSAGLSCTTCSSPDANPVATTVYTLNVTDACGLRSAVTTCTVNPVGLPAIAGPTSVCIGSTISLTDAFGGGTWSSSTTSVATVGSGTGIVSGISSGTTTITYTAGGCTVTLIVTVYPTPAAISGSSSICVGSTTTLSDATTGGAWSSNNTSVATIGSSTGVITGISAGTATISYIMPAGCFKTFTITVLPQPASITGSSSLCVGFNTTLSDATTGGTWSSSITSVVSIGSGTGIASGISVGTSTITYKLSTGCYTTFVMTVISLPSSISGPGLVCLGSNITLSDATAGGTWSSSNSAIAGLGSSTGIVTGNGVGTATVTYTYSIGCYVTSTITVSPLPATITGISRVCVGHTSTLSDATTGGTWSSSNTSVATVSSGGLATGVSVGTTTITYMLGTGCYTTFSFTVDPNPTPILGLSSVCIGSTITLSDATSGGVWTSSSTSTATIGSGTGIVTGISAGVVTITYSVGSCYVTYSVTVNPLPVAITGLSSLCVGGSITLSDATSGGTWSSSTTSVGTVSTGGIVTGVSAGTTTISYTLSTGCYVTKIITINPLPSPISGSASVCVGSVTTLSDSDPGGTWTSSNTSIATVGSGTGVVTGISAGTATVTYTLSTGCAATITVTVNPLPVTISGPSSVCIGSSITVSDATAGGTWSSANTSVATITTGTGVITGVSTGTSTITYLLSTGCYTTKIVTVNPLPGVISGSGSMCVGSSISLSDATSGGTWSSSNSTVASIGSTGTVIGNASGTATITYTTGASCYVTTTVTVNPLPASIAGPSGVCIGSVVTLSDATSGGIWSSSTSAVATINSSGNLTGVSLGTSVITYTLSTGCYVTRIITVNPLPSAITGLSSICSGATTTLSDATSGGTWSSSNTTVATVGSATAVVTGFTGGTAVITYTLATGCYATFIMSVYPLPGAIAGPHSVCVGSTIALSDATSGGVWSSTNTSVATISGGGIVSGITSGTTTISYTLGTGCSVTFIVTVNPLPGTILGRSQICLGSSTVLSDATTGGTWASSNTTVATIGSITGTVTSIGVGTTTITYTLSTGCYTTIVFTVSPLPAMISGTMSWCMGATSTLSDATSGGVWSSSNTSVVTIGSGSGIATGVISGTATITYTLVTGCFVTATVTIIGPAPITGPTAVCIGNTITLSDATTGGTWSSGNTSIATVSGGGVVTGATGGSVVITYTATVGGCVGVSLYTVSVIPLPVIHPNAAVVFCGVTTLTANPTAPPGWTFSWAPATGLSSTTGVSVTCVGPLPVGLTVYTITVTNAYGCISTALDSVVNMDCMNQFCYFCGGNWIPLGGNIGTVGTTTVLGPGNYYTYANLTFLGTVKFQGAVVAISSGKSMTVDAHSDLEIQHSHLFTCDPHAMWQGITLASTSTPATSGTCHVYENSLIEDAITAVQITDAVLPISGVKVFSSDGAIFNRNVTAVSIVRFPAIFSSALPIPTLYPFLIRNTVFTSRDLGTFSGYPCSWPAPEGTATSLKQAFSPVSALLPPYNVDNPNAAGLGLPYRGITCKLGMSADVGIDLQYVGDYAGGVGPLTPATFNDIVIGDNSTATYYKLNLFDTLHLGIKAQYSNVTSYTAAFIHMYQPTSSAVLPPSGIYATAPAVTLPPTLAGHKVNRLQLVGAGSLTAAGPVNGNLFYDCVNGVWCNEYYYVIGANSQMYSSNHTPYVPVGVQSGTYGYNIQSSRYKQIYLKNNYMVNIFNTGIFVKTLNVGLGAFLEAAGNMDICNNSICSNIGGTTPAFSQYVENGIVATNVTGTYTHTVTAVVNTNSNNITYVRNGITVKNFNWQPVVSDSNTISMVVNPAPSIQQYGITHQNCTADTIYLNKVLGPGGFVPFFPLTSIGVSTLDRTLVGVYEGGSSASFVKCNEIDSTNIGFEFFGQLSNSTWLNNTMVKNNYGYVLKGSIGPQGTTIDPSDNVWVGTSWWGATFAGGKIPYNTVTLGTPFVSPTFSPLYVRNTSPSPGTMFYNPAFNRSNPVSVPNTYGSGGPGPGIGLNVVPGTPAYPPCEHVWTKNMALAVIKAVAQQTVGYATSIPLSNWVGQMALYNNMVYDSSIADSSAVALQFQNMSYGSRYKLLNDIDQALAIEDTTFAMRLLKGPIDADTTTAYDTVTGVYMADDTAADPIVSRYLMFYNIYLNYKRGIMTPLDQNMLTTIANLCPYRDGNVVYEARGLYSMVFDDPGVFNDNCEDTITIDTCEVCYGGGGGESKYAQNGPHKNTAAQGQKYRLYPNPNNGSFMLQQEVSDEKPGVVEVWDAVGRLIYQKAQSFTNLKTEVEINGLVPGTYLLKLTDSKNNKYNFRFVVTKQ